MLSIKNLSSLILLLFALSIPVVAQQTMDREITSEDYERMLQNAFKIDFRKYVIEELDMTSEEIEAFTPIYMEYMNDLARIVDKRNRLVDDIRDDMQEDDSAKDKEEEMAGFIENYWETEIKAMELRKDYFDKLEEVLPVAKAATFFELEGDMQYRLSRMNSMEKLPSIGMGRVRSNTYDRPVDAYNNWMLSIQGKEDLSHEYTQNGLNKLVGAIDAIAQAENLQIPNWQNTKQQILQRGEEITQNWKETNHADKTREAFIMLAETLTTVQNQTKIASTADMTKKLTTAANAVDGKVMMTKQKDKIYNFFDTAQELVNTMVRSLSAKSTTTR